MEVKNPGLALPLQMGVGFRRMKDWSECLEVERNSGRVSGAWLFRAARHEPRIFNPNRPALTRQQG
jgi:hypothetical protein